MPQSELPIFDRPTLNRRFRAALSARPDKAWWGPFRRGLFVDPAGSHYRRMKGSLWLYGYLVVHADRQSGTLYRLLPTIAREMGVSERTVRHWLANLRRHGYVTTRPTGRATQIRLAKWQPFGKAR